MSHAMEHCDRPWWKRPPAWLIGIALVVALVTGVAFEMSGKSTLIPYSAFLDQLDAGNVASVTFQATEIDGRFKQPLSSTTVSGTAQSDTFHSRVPDVGDPTLVPELRKQRVAIDVNVPSAWAWLLGRVPWPMLIFFAAMLVGGLVRLLRGGKTQTGSAGSTPMHGMMGLVSGLFGKQSQSESDSVRTGDQPKA